MIGSSTDRLVGLVTGASADELPLHLQVRLRAAADAQLTIAGSPKVADADDASAPSPIDGQAYLDLMTQALAHGWGDVAKEAALRRLQQQSKRYLQLVRDSTERLSALNRNVLVSALQAGQRSSGELCVLTIGASRYVSALLRNAATCTHFTVVIAEDRPDGSGHRTAAELLEAGVPVRMIEFGAVARCMAQVQLVVCGAHAVLADGGVLGPVGTLTVAHAAAAHGTPLYVAVPHHALCHTRHLDATAQCAIRGVPFRSDARILRERPRRDSTPPQLVTLLLTDIGVLTASAVADEMLGRQQRPGGSVL